MKKTAGRRKAREFSVGTIRRLQERVAYMCSNPLCRRLTVGPQTGSFNVVRQGKAAHICAASPGGARSKNTMSDEECRAFENGIWLCDICARLVDDNRNDYPEALLGRWKEEAELYVAELSTQDTRLRQLRGMVTDTLSALRILGAVPGPGPVFDQTFADERNISLARRFIESEQLLFENSFVAEAESVRIIGSELLREIHVAILNNPVKAYLDISEWKNRKVRVLMIEVMRFSEESYERYLERELQMVGQERTRQARAGYEIRTFPMRSVSAQF
jgi:hypothetical protein